MDLLIKRRKNMTNTKTKILNLIILFLLAISLALLAGCGDKHSHNFAALSYVVEGEKAYEVKSCSCGETQRKEIENAVVANNTNLETKLASAKAGSIVVLSKGDYALISLIGVDSFKDDITITAFEDVRVDGLLITSGLTKQEYETKSSTLSRNLTITNIKFTDDIQVRNCTIAGLSIKDCHFTGEARININVCSFSAAFKTHINAKDGDMVKFGYDDIATNSGITNSAININIENNTFEGVHDSILDETTVIYLASVNGATVKNNIINSAEFNGIQITSGGDYNSKGDILVEGNTIKNTGSRSMRFSYFEDSAKLIVKNNILSNANTLETNSEVIKSSGMGGATIVYEGNIYNGVAISVGNNITQAL